MDSLEKLWSIDISQNSVAGVLDHVGIQNKLKTLAFSKLMLQQKLQQLLSEKIISNVLVAFPKKGKGMTKLGTYQNKAIKKAISSLVANKQR